MITLTEQEARILRLVEPQAQGLGLEVVRLRVMGGKRPGLQIMIDRAGGAPSTVDDCAKLSRALGPVFDADDPLPDAYTLEVSTPGIDRPLTRIGDFGRWIGQAAKIELAIPLDGRRRFQGVIAGEDEDGVKLMLDDETELVARIDEMSKASLLLTDQLIEEAGRRGALPPQDGDDDLEEFDVEVDNDEENEAQASQRSVK